METAEALLKVLRHDMNKRLFKSLYNTNIVNIVNNTKTKYISKVNLLTKELNLTVNDLKSIQVYFDNKIQSHINIIEFLNDTYYPRVLTDTINYNIGRTKNDANKSLLIFKDTYNLTEDDIITLDEDHAITNMNLYKELLVPSKDNIARVRTIINSQIKNDDFLSEFVKNNVVIDDNGIRYESDKDYNSFRIINWFYKPMMMSYINYHSKRVYACKVVIADAYEYYRNASEFFFDNYIKASISLLYENMLPIDAILSNLDYMNSTYMIHEVFTRGFDLEDIRAIYPDYDRAIDIDFKKKRGF